MELIKFCVVLMFPAILVTATSSLRRLSRDLLVDYDNQTPPLFDNNGTIYVTHDLQLKRIVSLENQVLTLDAYIAMTWTDYQLEWDPSKYDDIRMIRLSSKHVWKPDIMLENNAEPFSGVHESDINVVVTDDGHIFYTLPVKTQSYCDVDHARIKRTHNVTCTLSFMSWTYDGNSIDLDLAEYSGIMQDFDPTFNKQWKLVDQHTKRNTKMYECCPEQYINLEYTFVLQKR